MGYIYKITNKENGKIYIGLTTRDVETRWKEHVEMANLTNHKDSNALFKKAIKKYGPETFIVETIDESDDIEELKQKEIDWIKKTKSYAFDEDGWGYNSTRGGDYPAEFYFTPVSQFDIVTGEKIKDYPSIREAERNIGCRIDIIGKPERSCGGYCFLYTKDIESLTKEELVEKIHSLYPFLVYQLDLNGEIVNIYKNTTEASKAIQGNQGNLISACNGQRRLAKGYQWCYQKDLEKRLHQPVREINQYTRPVVQYKMNGEKIKVWNSGREAAKELGLQESHINSCCNLARQTCGQYQWRYEEDEIEKLPELTQKRKVQCLETGEIFKTINHAAKHFNIAHQTVRRSVDGKKIFYDLHFRWYDD